MRRCSKVLRSSCRPLRGDLDVSFHAPLLIWISAGLLSLNRIWLVLLEGDIPAGTRHLNAECCRIGSESGMCGSALMEGGQTCRYAAVITIRCLKQNKQTGSFSSNGLFNLYLTFIHLRRSATFTEPFESVSYNQNPRELLNLPLYWLEKHNFKFFWPLRQLFIKCVF